MDAARDAARAAGAVHEILRERSPRAGPDLAPDLPLGPGGLGLDSIALVEVLLDCERRFGLALAAELLAGPPLTVGALVRHVAARAGGTGA